MRSTSTTRRRGTRGLIPPSPTAPCRSPRETVRPPLEPSGLRRPDRVEDRGVEALERARQHVRAEVGLVGVDPDPEDALLLRCLEHAEPTRPGDLEDDARSARDLLQGEIPAVRHLALAEAHSRIRVQCRDPRVGLPGAGPVAGNEPVDLWKLAAADGADDVLPGAALLHAACEVAGLFGGELDPSRFAGRLGRSSIAWSMIAKRVFGNSSAARYITPLSSALAPRTRPKPRRARYRKLEK